jgi:hypothetical protein
MGFCRWDKLVLRDEDRSNLNRIGLLRCQADGLTHSDKKMRDGKKPRETLRNLSSRNLNIFWVVFDADDSADPDRAGGLLDARKAMNRW